MSNQQGQPPWPPPSRQPPNQGQGSFQYPPQQRQPQPNTPYSQQPYGQPPWGQQPPYQQYYQQPPSMMPPPQKQKKHTKALWIGIGVVLALIVIISVVLSQSSNGSSSTSTDTTTATAAATTSNQPTTLGSSLSVFDAKFGNRGTTIDDNGGSYTWSTQYGNLDLYVDTLSSASLTDPTQNLVKGLLFSFPFDASSGSSPVLTNNAATELSRLFLPPDAVHMKDVISKSWKAVGEAILIKMYYSNQLANILPATTFTDHDGNQLKRGLITVLFSLNNEDKNQVTDVTVQAGEDLPVGFNP